MSGEVVHTIAALLGLLSLVYGCWLLSPAAAFITFGVLVLLGVINGRRK